MMEQITPPFCSAVPVDPQKEAVYEGIRQMLEESLERSRAAEDNSLPELVEGQPIELPNSGEVLPLTAEQREIRDGNKRARLGSRGDSRSKHLDDFQANVARDITVKVRISIENSLHQ